MNFDEPVQGHLHWTDSEYSDSRKDVLKTIIILSVVTVVEVSVAIGYDEFATDGGKYKWVINLDYGDMFGGKGYLHYGHLYALKA